MKKKKAKKKPVKQKIDVVLESLLNLEQKMRELIDKVKDLQTQIYYYPHGAEPIKYCPCTNTPYKYGGLTWNHSKPIVGYDSCTGQPVITDNWKNNKNKDSY